MRIIKLLTKRQQDTYNYLLSKFEQDETAYVTTEELLTNVDGYVQDLWRKHNSTGKRALISDIQTINECQSVEKIIISSYAFGYKIASKEEYLKWSDNSRAELIRGLYRLKTKDLKAKVNNQMIIDFENPNVKKYVETFE